MEPGSVWIKAPLFSVVTSGTSNSQGDSSEVFLLFVERPIMCSVLPAVTTRSSSFPHRLFSQGRAEPPALSAVQQRGSLCLPSRAFTWEKLILCVQEEFGNARGSGGPEQLRRCSARVG